MNISYQGKTIIVSAAGQGIGRASAELFAKLGGSVVVNDINPEAADATIAAIEAEGGSAKSYVADITQENEVNALVQFACDEFGGLDVMFNNAGGAFPTPLGEISSDEYRRIIALNLDSTYFGSMAALRVMTENGGGCILSTTSGAGLNAVAGLTIYAAAKAGVIALMKGIANEYGKQNIRALAISPGAMETPGLVSWLETLPGGVQGYNDAQPSGRLGRAEEIADAAAYLASDYASFINGNVIPVDGAVHAVLNTPG